MEIPTEYTIQSLYTHCKRPVYRKGEGVYNAECPVCKEGKSAGKKRRLFYFPSEHYFYCFNCARSWTELDWLTTVTGTSVLEIAKESKKFVIDITPDNDIRSKRENLTESYTSPTVPSIPPDSIDILDINQVTYYQHRPEKEVICKALEYSKQRRFLTCINRPKSLYVSYGDPVHSKRLIIPFYNVENKIQSYQSRALYENMSPKYLTKYGEKCFFGENTVTDDIPYLFITEGPVDAMFIRNGIGAGGAKITDSQKLFLQRHFDKEPVFIFDNDKNNIEMQKIIEKTIKQGKRVFIWPKEIKRFKDINELCCHLELNHISNDFLLKNSFSGLEAMLKFKLSLTYN